MIRDAHGEAIDRGLVLTFRAPRSYTGEDMVEFQLHANPVIVERLVEASIVLGARPARPGEFTQRAFVNGRIDLAQAEAVADLIEARDRIAARAALRSLEGEFSRRVKELEDLLRQARVCAEAGLDFSDQDIDEELEGELRRLLETATARLAGLKTDGERGAALRREPRVLLLGRPNVGKSSLFNRLVGEERAIVTAVAGTTRDLLEGEVLWEGLRLRLHDGAGLRASGDPIEQEGVIRVRHAAREADLVVYVLDARDGWTEDDRREYRSIERARRMAVVNKIDLTHSSPLSSSGEEDEEVPLGVSALRGEGLAELRRRIRARLSSDSLYDGEEGVYLARRRHLQALEEAALHVRRAQRLVSERGGVDLAAEEIRWAQQALTAIVGGRPDEQLLDDIFRRFCIGK